MKFPGGTAASRSNGIKEFFSCRNPGMMRGLLVVASFVMRNRCLKAVASASVRKQ
jgi:hypothetical protein